MRRRSSKQRSFSGSTYMYRDPFFLVVSYSAGGSSSSNEESTPFVVCGGPMLTLTPGGGGGIGSPFRKIFLRAVGGDGGLTRVTSTTKKPENENLDSLPIWLSFLCSLLRCRTFNFLQVPCPSALWLKLCACAHSRAEYGNGNGLIRLSCFNWLS